MRHRKAKRQLNCTPAHRRAMFSNMSASLIKNEEIVTTLVKAKRLRQFIEPLITIAGKNNSSDNNGISARRRVFSKLRDKETVHKLFSDIGPYYKERCGGYTRILKKGFRKGDNAPLAHVSFVGRKKLSQEDGTTDSDKAGEAVANAE